MDPYLSTADLPPDAIPLALTQSEPMASQVPGSPEAGVPASALASQHSAATVQPPPPHHAAPVSPQGRKPLSHHSHSSSAPVRDAPEGAKQEAGARPGHKRTGGCSWQVWVAGCDMVWCAIAVSVVHGMLNSLMHADSGS